MALIFRSQGSALSFTQLDDNFRTLQKNARIWDDATQYELNDLAYHLGGFYSASGSTTTGIAPNIVNSGWELLKISASSVDLSDYVTIETFNTHTGSTALHLTPAQNVLLDGLNPILTSDNLNTLVGIESNVQGQLDGKAPLIHLHPYLPTSGGTVNGAVTINGDLNVFSGVITGDGLSIYNIPISGVTGLQIALNNKSDVGHKHYELYQPNGLNPFVYTDNGGTLHIDGNIVQSGSTYETHAEQLYTKKDYIFLREGAIGGLSPGQYAGFEAIKYDGINNGRLVFDNTGTARVGDIGFEYPLALRDESIGMTNRAFTYWSSPEDRIKTSNLTLDNIGDLYVGSGRTINAGVGLVGGGNLSNDITISHADTSSATSISSINNLNGVVLRNLEVLIDGFGHVSGGTISTYDLDNRYYTETESDSRFVNTSGDIINGNLSVSGITSTGALAVSGNTIVNGNLTVSGTTTSNIFVSKVLTGLAPFNVSSTTLVQNLNADLLDGYQANQLPFSIPQQAVIDTLVPEYWKIIRRADILWAGDWIKIAHETSLSLNAAITNVTLKASFGYGLTTLDPIINFPAAVVSGGGSPYVGFYVRDANNLLSQTADFNYIEISYTVNDAVGEVNYNTYKFTFGEYAIHNEYSSSVEHSNQCKLIFKSEFPEYETTLGYEYIETIYDPLAGYGYVNNAYQPYYCGLRNANMMVYPYQNGGIDQNFGSNPNLLEVSAHYGNYENVPGVGNIGVRHDITSGATIFLSNTVTCGARKDDVTTLENCASWGYGLEFFEESNDPGLDAMYPAKLYPVALCEATTNEDGTIVTSYVHLNFTNKLVVGDYVTIRYSYSPDVWETRQVHQILSENSFSVLSGYTPTIAPFIYAWYNVPIGTYIAGGDGYWESAACPIIGAKLKKIKLATKANWQLVRKAARATAISSNNTAQLREGVDGYTTQLVLMDSSNLPVQDPAYPGKVIGIIFIPNPSGINYFEFTTNIDGVLTGPSQYLYYTPAGETVKLYWDAYRGFGKINVANAITWIETNYSQNSSYIDVLADSLDGTHGINSLLNYGDIYQNSPVAKRMLEDRLTDFVPKTTTINAGVGLTGGGDLSNDITISHADTSSATNIASINNLNGVVLRNLEVLIDGFGHVSGGTVNTYDLDNRYYTETESDSRFVNTSGDTMTGVLYGTVFDGDGVVVDYVKYNSGATPTLSPGMRAWNDVAGTTELRLKGDNVTLQDGQEVLIYCYNNSGVDIHNGDAVTIVGGNGDYDFIELAIGTHGTNTKYRVNGVATEEIPNGAYGFITNFGKVHDLDLSYFNPNDEVYLSQAQAGKLVKLDDLDIHGRVTQIGKVIQNGVNGILRLNIMNEPDISTNTLLELNVLTANDTSTGVYAFDGITLDDTSHFSVGAAKGWIVDNTTDPIHPTITYVDYAGQSGLTTPYINTNNISYILLNIGGTLDLQSTYPTPTQRRQSIFLGNVGHPDKTALTTALNVTDQILSPVNQLRDMFTCIPLINDGIFVSPNGANLSLNNSDGFIYGMGINFADNSLDPNRRHILSGSQIPFKYRTQLGGSSANVTVVDPTVYDNNGVITAIGSPAKQATNQRIYMLQNGEFRIQYGQTIYSDLATAIANVSTETFITFPGFKTDGILIGVLSVSSDATNLSSITSAKILGASKFGEAGSAVGGSGGAVTLTLQIAYDNGNTIITNPINDGVIIRRGSNADTDKLLRFQNGDTQDVATIDAQGNAVFSTMALATNAIFDAQSGSVVSGITTTVAYVSTTNITAAFFDYVAINGNNVICGTVIAAHDSAGNTTYTDYSTPGLGNVNTISFSVVVVNGNLQLKASTTANWLIKTTIRTL